MDTQTSAVLKFALALPPRERTLWRERMASRPCLTRDLILQIPHPAPKVFLQTEAMRACTTLYDSLPAAAKDEVLARIPIQHTQEEVIEHAIRRHEEAPPQSKRKRPDPTERQSRFIKFIRLGYRGEQLQRALVQDGLRHPEDWMGNPEWKSNVSKERARIVRKFGDLCKPINPAEHDGGKIESKRTNPA